MRIRFENFFSKCQIHSLRFDPISGFIFLSQIVCFLTEISFPKQKRSSCFSNIRQGITYPKMEYKILSCLSKKRVPRCRLRLEFCQRSFNFLPISICELFIFSVDFETCKKEVEKFRLFIFRVVKVSSSAQMLKEVALRETEQLKYG